MASAVLEELKRLPFDDPNLDGNNNLDAGKAPTGGDPVPTDADHIFDAAELPVLNSTFHVDGNDIIDGAGRLYQLFWNVQDSPVNVGTNTFTPSCTIRLFVYWDTSMGKSHLEMTAVKYNNS